MHIGLAAKVRTFDLEFLSRVKNFMPLNTKIYLITNSFRSRQAYGGSYADFVYRSVLALYNAELSSEKHKYSLTPPAIGYYRVMTSV